MTSVGSLKVYEVPNPIPKLSLMKQKKSKFLIKDFMFA